MPPLMATRGDHDVPMTIVLMTQAGIYKLGAQVITCDTIKPDGQVIHDSTAAHYIATDSGFTYTLPPEAYEVAGKLTLGFSFSGGDSTSQFELTVLPRPGENIVSNSYVTQIDELLVTARDYVNAIGNANKTAVDYVNAHKAESLETIDADVTAVDDYKTTTTGKMDASLGVVTTAQSTQTEAMAKSAKAVADTATTETNAIKQSAADTATAATNAQTTINTAASDATISAANVAAIEKTTQGNLDGVIEDLKSDYQEQIKQAKADWSEALGVINQNATDASKKATDAINAAYQAKVDEITADWQKQIDALKKTLTSQMADVTAKLTQAADTDVPALVKQLADLKTQADTIQEQTADSLSGVILANGTALTVTNRTVTLPDFQTADQVSTAVAAGGKTKTVSLNAGTPVAPDATGNIDLTVPIQSLDGYAKTSDIPDVSGFIKVADADGKYVLTANLAAAIAQALTDAGAVTEANLDDKLYAWKAKAFPVMTNAQFTGLTAVDDRNNYMLTD